MKNKLLIIIGVLAIAGTSVNAGWFGAGVKPVPYIKVPLVKLVVPFPSAVAGPRAGTEADANISTQGASAALPWVASFSQMAELNSWNIQEKRDHWPETSRPFKSSSPKESCRRQKGER